jgi:hypothetical protein
MENLIRGLIREVLAAGAPTVLYHGTLHERVPSIMRAGLTAGPGWGGAPKPGVFLSPTREDAEYWAKMALARKLGMPGSEDSFDILDTDALSQIAIIEVHIPLEEAHNIIPRVKSFSLLGDVQFVGSIPPEWLNLT